GCEANLIQSNAARSYRIGAEHKDDGICPSDQRLDPLPPLLEGIDVGAINQRFEATSLQRRLEAIRKGHVLARIGDEDSGFGFGFNLLLSSVGRHDVRLAGSPHSQPSRTNY